MKKIFKKRRDLSHKLALNLFDCERPDGAFYLYMDIKKYLGQEIKSCHDFSLYLLDKSGVALLPGSAFGREGFLRLSFASSEEDIKEAFKRIESAL